MAALAEIAVGFATGLALNADFHAEMALPSNNPCGPIVAPNVFGLNPSQSANAQSTRIAPKIAPNGIMLIFGQFQVLFKVADAS